MSATLAPAVSDFNSSAPGQLKTFSGVNSTSAFAETRHSGRANRPVGFAPQCRPFSPLVSMPESRRSPRPIRWDRGIGALRSSLAPVHGATHLCEDCRRKASHAVFATHPVAVANVIHRAAQNARRAKRQPAHSVCSSLNARRRRARRTRFLCSAGTTEPPR